MTRRTMHCTAPLTKPRWAAAMTPAMTLTFSPRWSLRCCFTWIHTRSSDPTLHVMCQQLHSWHHFFKLVTLNVRQRANTEIHGNRRVSASPISQNVWSRIGSVSAQQLNPLADSTPCLSPQQQKADWYDPVDGFSSCFHFKQREC